MGIEKVVQDLAQRASSEAQELNELLVLEASQMSLSNIPWRRAHGITELINELEFALEVRSIEKLVDLKLQLR